MKKTTLQIHHCNWRNTTADTDTQPFPVHGAAEGVFNFKDSAKAPVVIFQRLVIGVLIRRPEWTGCPRFSR